MLFTLSWPNSLHLSAIKLNRGSTAPKPIIHLLLECASRGEGFVWGSTHDVRKPQHQIFPEKLLQTQAVGGLVI